MTWWPGFFPNFLNAANRTRTTMTMMTIILKKTPVHGLFKADRYGLGCIALNNLLLHRS